MSQIVWGDFEHHDHDGFTHWEPNGFVQVRQEGVMPWQQYGMGQADGGGFLGMPQFSLFWAGLGLLAGTAGAIWAVRAGLVPPFILGRGYGAPE